VRKVVLLSLFHAHYFTIPPSTLATRNLQLDKMSLIIPLTGKSIVRRKKSCWYLYDGERYLSDQIRQDRNITTRPDEDKRRRTIILHKRDDKDSYGFALQTYGIHHQKNGEIELLTYVDSVDVNSSAAKSGLREGDVILSINGVDVERADHRTLVDYIKSCQGTMRMVVLFEDCVRKVELHRRFLKLKRILNQKAAEFERLCLREELLLSTRNRRGLQQNLNHGANSSATLLNLSSSSSNCSTTSSSMSTSSVSTGVVNSHRHNSAIVSSDDISLQFNGMSNGDVNDIDNNRFQSGNRRCSDTRAYLLSCQDDSGDNDVGNSTNGVIQSNLTRTSTLPRMRSSISFGHETSEQSIGDDSLKDNRKGAKKSSRYSSLFHPGLSQSLRLMGNSGQGIVDRLRNRRQSDRSNIYSVSDAFLTMSPKSVQRIVSGEQEMQTVKEQMDTSPFPVLQPLSANVQQSQQQEQVEEVNCVTRL